jgi:hypothetical protein
VETLKILLAIALITPLIHMTLPVGEYEYYYDYYDEYYYIDYIELATTSRRLPSRPEDRSRPIIGGVQIQVVPEFCSSSFDLFRIIYCLSIANAKTCTAGYAVRVNNTVGFISAGHCADFNTGFHVYQPTYIPPVCYLSIPDFRWVCVPALTFFAGVVTWNSREYDVMFVKFSNVAPYILHIEGPRSFYLVIDRIAGYEEVEFNLRFYSRGVCKTGITTGTTCGGVFDVGKCDVGGNTVPRCIHVWARAAPGDSGSPLYLHYVIVNGSQVISAATLLGHVIGGNEDLGTIVASSVTNVLKSGFTPLTIRR